MADHIGTPGSNADTSVNGGSRVGNAPKDKACPFCKVQFTSSSLGRHLDLYIKEKNPKAPDGLHHVDEIRKLRGGITRRQPRNSIRKREDSTPAGTPGAHERRSSREDNLQGDRSPSLRRDEIGTSNILYNGKPRVLNMAGWEATGVMNHIPAARKPDLESPEPDEQEVRREVRMRNVSKQELAKSTFDQKQKMMDALDSARAAELALREILGSIRAANWRSLPTLAIFDYDPLTLDFPALCLHCLPPPPTLHSSTPIPNPNCWTITPPGDNQYEAIRSHFSTAFRNYRNTLAISSTEPVDDLSYPPPDTFLQEEDMAAQIIRAESQATDLESKIVAHLHEVFAVWTSFSPPRKSEIWTLELARSVGRKSIEIQKLKQEKEIEQQSVAHLKLQINDLSRLQQPREFRLVPPKTIPISQNTVNTLGDMATRDHLVDRSVGFSLLDRGEQLDVVIDRAVSRWKDVLREARGDSARGGLANQRSLSDGSTLHLAAHPRTNSGPRPIPSPNPNQHMTPNQNMNSIINPTRNPPPNQNPATINNNHSTSMPMSNGLESIGSDADADADADMEDEEDTYAELNDLSEMTGEGAYSRMVVNGNGRGKGSVGGMGNGGMEGIVSENRGAFGRIGS